MACDVMLVCSKISLGKQKHDSTFQIYTKLVKLDCFTSFFSTLTVLEANNSWAWLDMGTHALACEHAIGAHTVMQINFVPRFLSKYVWQLPLDGLD